MKYLTFILLILSISCSQPVEQENNAIVEEGETEATTLLKKQNEFLKEEIVKLTEGVHVAVGYDVSNITMVEGDDGVVLIDAGMVPRNVQKVKDEFAKITDKPIKGIVFTHGHGDHTGGTKTFIGDNKDVEIWGRDIHGSESDIPFKAGFRNVHRPMRQAGFFLQPEQRINNGIAIATYPTPNGGPMKPRKPGAKPKKTNFDTAMKPNRSFEGDSKAIKIAGIDIEMYKAPGETEDQLFVWLPKQKVLCTGDNFYRSWPNLYAIRGTVYRDVYSWHNSLTKMLEFDFDHLVPGHTSVFIGKEASRMALTNYRDAVKFVFEKTIEGMNKGMNPDELVEYVQLPDSLKNLPYLTEYYGRIDWSIRSIHNGYLGWFDGNATNLIPLTNKEEATRMAKLAGGQDKLMSQAQTALTEKDYQWAAQLADHLIALEVEGAKGLKADALTGLAMNCHNALGRNYYLTRALQLRR